MRPHVSLWLLLSMMVSCSGGGGGSLPSDAGPITASNPLGTVGGLVIDAATEAPMAGAAVTVIAGGSVLQAMTDANGTFAVANVPSGAFIATISGSGYESALINGALAGAVGGVPVDKPIATLGPVGLIKTDGIFAVKLVDQDGAPVPDVKVVARPPARWVDYSNGAPVAVGSYSVSATSGMDGIVNIAGLPTPLALTLVGDTLPIDVAPRLVSGATTVYEFLGGTFSFQVAHLGNTGGVVDQPIIRLAGPLTPLQVLASSLEMLRGLSAGPGASPIAIDYRFIAVIPYVQPAAQMKIEFNQTLNRTTVRAQLFNEDGSESPIAIMVGGTGNSLTLSPASALPAGTRFNLALHVDVARASGQPSIGRELNVTVPLFVAPAAGVPVRVIATSVKSLQGPISPPFTFQFSEPVGLGAANQTVGCIVFYDTTNVNLDNDPASLYPGEYDRTKPTQLNCPNPGLDITSMIPLEPPGFPITGFASRWKVTFDDLANDECKPGTEATCTAPAAGTQVFLKPSRAASASMPATFKRPDGSPVPDNDTNLSFPIPPP